ncbi:MAG: glycosyltransferase [Eubacteriales bacterium]
METVFFSIIVVSLNPGDKLKATIQSICSQRRNDIEVIIKDGMSTDGSVENLIEEGYLCKYSYITLIQKKDKSIYEGMNQAIEEAKGRYLLFLNCGDLFYDDKVLLRMMEAMEQYKSQVPAIFYGNQYNEVQKTIVYSAPTINDFTCYRNVPCHQVCFYDRRLFTERGYLASYRVRADYEHFLYSIYEKMAQAIYVPVIVAKYEGGGFSETRENRIQSSKEHQMITKKYLGSGKVLRYKIVMLLTLAPLRTWIAENPKLSKGYNQAKTGIYKLIKR